MSDHYVIVIEGDAGTNFSAYAPDVLGCIATGKTIEQTIGRMRNALGYHLEAMRQDGEAIPPAHFKFGGAVEFPDEVVGMVEIDIPAPRERTTAVA